MSTLNDLEIRILIFHRKQWYLLFFKTHIVSTAKAGFLQDFVDMCILVQKQSDPRNLTEVLWVYIDFGRVDQNPEITTNKYLWLERILVCMKGYRKISDGYVNGCIEGCDEENGYLDNQIRGCVHGPMIEEMQKNNVDEFYIVVYKKISKS